MSIFGFSQDLTYMVFGKITNEDTKKPEAGVTISMMSGGKVVTSVVTSSNGKYNLVYDGQMKMDFVLTYSKSGFVTKKVGFNGSKMNQEDIPAGAEFPLPTLDMGLFSERPNVDFSFLNSEQVASFFWDESRMQINFDQASSAKTKKKIEDLLAAQPVTTGPSPDDLKYNEAIKNGDALFNQKKYKEALAEYEEASVIKPKEKIPLAKIAEIDKLLKAQQAEQSANQQLETEYKNLITAADNLRDQKKYTEAIAKYNEAIKKKDEAYPKGEISKLNVLLADQKAKETQFELLKKDGLALATSKKWSEAKTKLESAIAIKPDPAISLKIKEIDTELAKESADKAKNEKYNTIMSEAESLLTSGKLVESKAKFTEASTLEPTQTLPKQKIKEVTDLIANQTANAAKKAKVDKLISEGTTLMAKNDLAGAKLKYEEVLKEEVGNTIATAKIQEINGKLDAQKGQAEKEVQFEALKKEGMILATAKKFSEAKAKLEQAIALKADPVISQKIIEIDNAIKATQSQATLDEEYKKIINEASVLEGAKNYDGAIAKYKEAGAKKATETLPKTKIAELEKLKIAQAKEEANKGQAEKDAQFEALKKEGLALFTSKKYTESKTKLEQALVLKPDAIVSQKIQEIDKVLKDLDAQSSVEDAYKKIISEAAVLEASKDYVGAISKYKEAGTKKPSEALPKSKVTELEKLKKAEESLNQAESQKNALYDKHIAAGNKNLNDKKYELALTEFQSALLAKPNDNIAQNKLAEVKQLMDDLSKANAQNSDLKKNIDKLMLEADRLFKQEKYLDAKALYEKVLTLESDNQIAKNQIAECDRLEIAKGVTQGDNEYKKLVSAADKKFNEKNYLKAKEYYERAVGIRSTDPYPKQKLAEIEALLNPKQVVVDTKTIASNGSNLDPEKLQPLGIPYSKDIIDAKDELKKAEIAREVARNKELNSGIQNVNDRSGELEIEKHDEHLKTTKGVDDFNTSIEKENSSKDAGHQDVIELNKKVSKEQNDKTDQSNLFEDKDHLQIQDKMNLVVQENDVEYVKKDIVFVNKGDFLKKEKDDFATLNDNESIRFDGKNVDSKQNIIEVEHKIIDKQIDDKESRKAVEDRIESTVNKTVEKNDQLNNTETGEILNSKIQLHEAEKKMGDKVENDMLNANDVSVDLTEIKLKVQESTDQSIENKTEASNKAISDVVDLNKKIASDQTSNDAALQNSNEMLKKANKTLNDDSNEEFNKEMVKYLASKNNLDNKLDKIDQNNTTSNDKLIEHNGTIKDMTTSLNEEHGKQLEVQNDKNLSAQQSIHDKQNTVNTEKPVIANSLGKEYPEGVSQESFTQNDENGLMKAIITRRVVVVGGKGDVYVRTQTLNTITYSKNGSPSSERVWQKETQGPNLEKHY